VFTQRIQQIRRIIAYQFINKHALKDFVGLKHKLHEQQGKLTERSVTGT